MRIRTDYNTEYLSNEAEDAVFEELERQLSLPENENVCVCQDCVLDMAAYALNNIKPAYRSTLLGRLYTEAMSKRGSSAEEIKKSVTRAIEVVSSNPAHD
ncbi:MAG: late competence development ComFB family protein [Spirochaetales bacterium]|nr:late competence development ComFB family protein [Spirochaetales bacterium]MCF7937483.1 late competence development ComFB family protein [Spirochaetales bacterium]